MNISKIILRPAKREDSPMIAKAVAMAIGDEVALRSYCGEDYISVLTAISLEDATQYSWRNAIVAEYADKVVGVVVGYDGARLKELRDGTFVILQEYIGRVPTLTDETEAGEYYLDSIAVFPEFQGLGVGTALINAFCSRAFFEGAECVGLIVDIDNQDAEKLYATQGFERVGERSFFGHQMWHLQKSR